MQDSAKYLIHADIRASGVVERSDVVGAIFGQTEGLLGDELDLRDLQESSKVGRIDVQISSEAGRSYGTVTIASGLDRVETAVLAAALETIDRIGPCRAEFEVRDLEDAREAKRREVVDRATDLLTDLEESTLSSRELVEEVRRNVRVEDITEFEGLPAGPRVVESDAIVVVEGRADVLQLLKYGIKNAIAVEGTDVPDAVASLTRERTVTAFLDGDRGGDLILKELTQVGDVDYVAFAPAEHSVEDLSREDVLSALRKKVPYDHVADASSPRAAIVGESGTDDRVDADGGAAVSDHSGTDTGGATRAEAAASEDSSTDAVEGRATATTTTAVEKEPPDGADDTPDDETAATAESGVQAATGTGVASTVEESGDGQEAGQQAEEPAGESEDDTEPAIDESVAEADESDEAVDADEDGDTDDATAESPSPEPETVAGHVDAVIGERTGRVRLLDEEFDVIDEADAENAFEAVEDVAETPYAVVIDGELSQRVLDVAAQRGVTQIIARSEGEYVKQPTNVRVLTAAEI